MPLKLRDTVFGVYPAVYRILPGPLKSRAVRVGVSLLFASVLELVGIGSLIPLFAIILSDEGLSQYPWLLELLGDLGVETEKGAITFLALCSLLAVIIKNMMVMFIQLGQVRFSLTLFEHFTKRSFNHYLDKGYSYFKSVNSNRTLHNIERVPLLFGNRLMLPMLSLASELIVVALIGLALFAFNPMAMLLLLGVVLPMFFLSYRAVKKRMRRASEEIDRLEPLARNSLHQSITGYVDVIISGKRPYFFRQYGSMAKQLKNRHVTVQIWSLFPNRIIETAMVMSIVIVCVYGIWFLDSKQDLLTLLGMMGLCATRIMPSVNRIIIALVNIKAFRYLLTYLEQTAEKGGAEGQLAEPLPSGDIVVEGLSLAMDDNQILNGVDLVVKRGEVIGLMGESGSGKSTLLNTILGLYQPDQGDVKVGDKSIFKHLRQWRDSISFVEQSVFLLDASIAENIAFGVPKDEIDLERVERALEGANLKAFLSTLPDGLDTMVGEMGAKLSGGQKQRIGIARALYQEPEVLFFDEATSALDNRTEMEIMSTIAQLKEKGYTIIMVAHRITTLNICDRIYEIEQGQVKRTVSYVELMKELEAMQADI